jgi:hypothetical protein
VLEGVKCSLNAQTTDIRLVRPRIVDYHMRNRGRATSSLLLLSEQAISGGDLKIRRSSMERYLSLPAKEVTSYLSGSFVPYPKQKCALSCHVEKGSFFPEVSLL